MRIEKKTWQYGLSQAVKGSSPRWPARITAAGHFTFRSLLNLAITTTATLTGGRPWN